MKRETPVLIGGIGGALLGALAFGVYVNSTPALLKDGMTVLFFPPIMLFCGMIGVALGVIVGLFFRKS